MSLNYKRFKFNFTHLLILLVLNLFLIIVFLCFIILSNEAPACYATYKENKATFITSSEISSHRLAVLVPFRDRFDELLVFAPYMHNFLNSQKVKHDIFILNQVDNYRFNRASLINIGYHYTRSDFDYVAMHDVDLLPLNTNLSYAYPRDQPFHVAAPHLHPRYHYEKFVGGILLINREQFALVNGMSNKYWGWGLEDDEFFVRLRGVNLNVTRPVNITTGIKDTFRHVHDRNHRKRDTTKCYKQREVTRKRDKQTGLHNVNYTLVSVNAMTIDNVPLTILNIKLICNHELTPWCDCNGASENYMKQVSTPSTIV